MENAYLTSGSISRFPFPAVPLLGPLLVFCLSTASTTARGQESSLQPPAQHFGHVIGADRKLVGWEELVEYMRRVADASDRVNFRDLGRSTHDRPFILLEIGSEETIANLEKYKQLQQRLYFQEHLPGQDPEAAHRPEEQNEIFEQGKAVVLVTCSIHATEVGAAQMSLELVHHLATSDSPRVRKILDNVILLLVPSLNPDGLAMVVDWYNRFVGTEFEGGPMPWLYHPYPGHDNNRDMYMYTQVETKWIGQILYKEWFPSLWLDEHQMGSMGARIFVMPAADPINLNVHPLIYRLNGIYGQAQAAALERAGKVGIIYDQIYTNYWQGAMAWTGWWHNQVGMLTELASVRIATPTEQNLAKLGEPPEGPPPDSQKLRRRMLEHPDEPLPAPYDVEPRTNYPRPWLGGKWTLRDIVEYELVATLGLLEAAADTRRQLVEQIYEVNRTTIAQFLNGQESAGLKEAGARQGYHPLPEGIPSQRAQTGRVMEGFAGAGGTPYAVVIPADQPDPPTVHKMLQILELGGVKIERAGSPFAADGKTYPAGTTVIRLAQVFGRYAKDMLEAQSYPEVRPAPNLPASPPYDVTAWSLGMLMGIETTFVNEPFEADLELLDGIDPSDLDGRVIGNGSVYLIDSVYNDGFKAVNGLLEKRARVRRTLAEFESGPSDSLRSFAAGTWVIEDISRREMESITQGLGLTVYAVGRAPSVAMTPIRKPRLAIYQPWDPNMDEGWTRWLLEAYDFEYTTLHAQDFRAAGSSPEPHSIPDEERKHWPPHVADRAPATVGNVPLASRYDVIVFPHQSGEDIVEGIDYPVIPPLYRGGIGEAGIEALRQFVDAGGTLIALGDATQLLIKHWPTPVRNVVEGLEPDEFLIPGSILSLESDPSHPLAWGLPRQLNGYFGRNPAFTLTDGFSSQEASVPIRYPNQDLRASGWVRGEDHMAGRAAAVQVDLEGAGRLVLLGLRPQHRAQTHATFKLLFNALMAMTPRPTS